MESNNLVTVTDGIVIGGAGGAIAGLTVYIVQYLHNKVTDSIESRRIFNWLKKNTSDEPGKKFRSTRAIASWNNLTEDRVRHLCSTHEGIFLSTGQREDLWSLYARRQEPGITII